MGSYAKPMDWQKLLSFLSGGGGKKLFTQCIFGRDFLSLGIKNYPNACMSCCSDDLALLLPRLDL